MSYFKIAVLTVFSVATVVGVIVFALSKYSGGGVGSAKIVVWGTIPEDVFNIAYTKSPFSKNRDIEVTYVQKSQSEFNQDFIEALADGSGPDVVILRDDYVYKNRNKLLTVPYKNYSERVFKDTFIEEGELFLNKDGVVAFPFMIDPMVMFWNRDLFASNQISLPPKYWEEMDDLVSKITQKDTSGNVLLSTLALGEWRNVTNAKEIISMLMLQAGTPITERRDDAVVSVLNGQFGQPRVPSQSALDFYTKFSNPTSPSYTWNRSLPNSLTFFLSGKLAIYFGFASDLLSIQQKNSNLNFDVASMPQIKGSSIKSTFGRLQAFAIVKQSKQPAAAYAFINAMIQPDVLLEIEKQTTLPPVRRDMLATIPTESFRNVFYSSALVSHSWIDPDPDATAVIFRDMIENITSGKARLIDSLSKANISLEAELR